MRTIDEIKDEIRGYFMANTTLRDLYGYAPGASFDSEFSAVSIEAILTYIVAVSIWSLESLMQKHSDDVDKRIVQQAVCSVPWYHSRCLAFQLGHSLRYDEATYSFGYDEIVESARIIKHAAVRQVESEGVTKLRIHVSKDAKIPLTAAQLEAFSRYINYVGAAGMHYEVISAPATALSFQLSIVRDPMVLDMQGNRLNAGGKPVDDAIRSYLDNIVYGGVFNRTKLIDAIQQADGVVDVVLNDVLIGGAIQDGQNIDSPGGAFTYNNVGSSIAYAV